MKFLTPIYIIITVVRFIDCSVITFYGNDEKSYAKYEPWQSFSNGLLKFRFKSTEPNGLLLYADDQYKSKGAGNFLKLKLVNKQLIVRIQISYSIGVDEYQSQVKKMVLGNNLNDNRYHYVELKRENEKIEIKLDSKLSRYIPPGNGQILNINSSVFLGGVPDDLKPVMDRLILDEKK